ncbi:MAG: PAS domain S-box protein [Syntrophobacteraceae bacterium]
MKREIMRRAKSPTDAPSLTVTLALAFFALSVSVLMIAGGFQLYSHIQTQQKAVSGFQELIAKDAAEKVNDFIQAKLGTLETAIWVANPDGATHPEQRELLRSLLGLQPALGRLTLLNADGRETARASRQSLTTPWALIDHLTEEAIGRVKQGKRVIGPVYIDAATGEPMVMIAVPVVDIFREYRGLLAAEVNLKFMWDLVDTLKVGATGKAYVVDRRGNLIAFSDTARVLKGENVAHLKPVDEFIHGTGSGVKNRLSMAPGITGITVVSAYVPLGTPDWAVIAELPWEEAYRSTLRGVVASFGIIVAVGILAGLIGIWVARRLTVPLVHLTEAANRIAAGDRNLRAEVTGPREVSSLASAFNSMTLQLRGSLEELEKRVEEVQLAEAALRQANQTLQALFDYSPLAIIILGLDRRVLHWNDAAEKMYGWTAQEVLGKHLPTLPDQQVEASVKRHESVLQGEIFTGIETERRCKDGSGLIVNISAAPLKDAEQKIYAVVSIAMDVTERKRAEEALRRNEEQLRLALMAASQGLFDLTLETGKALISPEYERMLGYEPGEISLTLSLWIELLHPDDRERTIRYYEEYISGKHDEYRVEFRQRMKSGDYKWILSVGKIVAWDPDGRPIRMIGTHADIDYRKETEEALLRTQFCVDHARDAVFWVGPDFELVYVNEAACRGLGYTREELLSMKVLDIDPRFNSELWQEHRSRLRDGGSTAFESIHQTRDGRTFPVEIAVNAMHFNGTVLHSAFVRDISERKLAEEEIHRLNEELEYRVHERTLQLEAANRELEAFAYSVSHDLRAPLRAVDGFTRILVEDHYDSLDAEGRRVCDIVCGEAKRMGELIDDLLTYSRMGRTEMTPVQIDMEALAQTVFDELTTSEDRKRIELQLKGLPKAESDRTMLHHVWSNLIGNALKFSSKREHALIEVGACQSTQETIYHVRDNGAGFDMRYAQKLFGVFQRLHSEREFEGTGVGLAIVARLVHRHGGRVWAESEPDKGATFYFTLPMTGQRT